MVENSGANDLIEGHAQLAHAFDSKLAYLKIPDVVLPFKTFGVTNTGCAAIDAGYVGRGPAYCMFGCLRSPATGYQDGLVLSINAIRPEQKKISSASLIVVPMAPIFVKTIDGRRIRVVIVEIANSFRDIAR
jgi:hypothetical protein